MEEIPGCFAFEGAFGDGREENVKKVWVAPKT